MPIPFSSYSQIEIYDKPATVPPPGGLVASHCCSHSIHKLVLLFLLPVFLLLQCLLLHLPPKSAVGSPAWASAASALVVPPIAPSVGDPLSKFLVAQQLPCFEKNGYTAWLYTFEDYAEQFKLSDEDCLHEVSCFPLGEAHVWHQDVQVSTWANWKAQAELRFAKHEPDATVNSEPERKNAGLSNPWSKF
ncbi:hypothetical protein DSO57_1023278 [Entomophthora muscae]|uniref:Uncharacterized protein n=1 Tax=Entomophthora muscae TaxID=34485 RepID=A0ACC2TQI6_9FUNG|nr:hypothetical protein DSO57_1023278 [Entomophthora muscae]